MTLAEAFREAGYATWATSSVQFTGRGSNLHQRGDGIMTSEQLQRLRSLGCVQ